MLCGYWGIFLITHLSLMCVVVYTVSDELDQPQNLSVSWNTNHFSVTAQWSEPAGLDVGCKVMYNVELYSTKYPSQNSSYIRDWSTEELNYTWKISEAYDAKCVAVSTIFQDCGNKTHSKPVYKDIPEPQDLVKNFSCIYYAEKKMNCTWNLVSNTSDLCFFYSDEKGNLKQCVLYTGDGSNRTGCHLYGEHFLSYEWFYILLNGMHEGRSIQNTFLRNPRESVTSQQPKLNITRDGDHLVFQPSRPDFKEDCWLYVFDVTRCSEDVKVPDGHKNKNWSVRVPYDESCKYTVRVQAKYSEYCGKGASDWSETEYYGVSNDPNWPLKATLIVIPVIMCCCLITALAVFTRYKDRILPVVPEPSLVFKDMFNDKKDRMLSKDLHVSRLYVPSEELLETKLHLEPKATMPHLEE